jgi:hypothetical protein
LFSISSFNLSLLNIIFSNLILILMIFWAFNLLNSFSFWYFNFYPCCSNCHVFFFLDCFLWGYQSLMHQVKVLTG